MDLTFWVEISIFWRASARDAVQGRNLIRLWDRRPIGVVSGSFEREQADTITMLHAGYRGRVPTPILMPPFRLDRRRARCQGQVPSPAVTSAAVAAGRRAPLGQDTDGLTATGPGRFSS